MRISCMNTMALAALMLASFPAQAAAPGAAAMTSMLLALFLILGLFVLVAWLIKRYLPQAGRAGPVKVVGSTAVGVRERVVVVEVGETWLVLGVGGGQVRTLHTLAKPAAAEKGG